MLKRKMAGLLLAILFLLSGGSPVPAAEVVTITGVVNEDFQIETPDGTIYEILEGEKGAEVFRKTGRTVRVTGEVEEVDGDRLILVLSYEILPSATAAPEGRKTGK